MLPFILSLLGSGAAGAGLLGGLSPLVAGALGSGIGTAAETGDLGKGIMAGLGGFAGGSVLGGMMNGASGAAMGAATNPATQLAQGATQQAGQQVAQQAASPQGIMGMLGGGGPNGMGGMLNQMLPGGPGLTAVGGGAAAAAPSAAMMAPGASAAGGSALAPMASMRPPMGAAGAGGGGGVMDIAKRGFGQGIMTGGGAGSALVGGMMYPKEASGKDGKKPGKSEPYERSRYEPGADYVPGKSGEFSYFDTAGQRAPRRYAGGGLVDMLGATAGGRIVDMLGAGNPFQGLLPMVYEKLKDAGEEDATGSQADPNRGVKKYMAGGVAGGMEPLSISGGGIADLPQDTFNMPNEKDVIGNAIAALENKLPEEQAAKALATFVKGYGEPALRKLIDDVTAGKTEADAGGGQVTGAGDGMDDMVPGQMQDGSEDVLVSDGEFIVPADVVSGLGNGSTDAGAAELERMAGRVRGERTGMPQQPPKIQPEQMVPA